LADDARELLSSHFIDRLVQIIRWRVIASVNPIVEANKDNRAAVKQKRVSSVRQAESAETWLRLTWRHPQSQFQYFDSKNSRHETFAPTIGPNAYKTFSEIASTAAFRFMV
jgi:hypothetical protein